MILKFIFVCLSMLAVVSAQFSSPQIDKHQVLAVGTGEVGSPYGTVTLTPGTIGELVIEVYFLASQMQFDAGINEAISIEVYSGVEDDEEDCMQGDLVLKTDGGNTVYTTELSQYTSYDYVLQLNGVPLVFSASSDPIHTDTQVSLMDDKHVEIDATTLGNFGSSDFSIEFTFSAIGEEDMFPDDKEKGGTLFGRTDKTNDIWTGPKAKIYENGDILFWMRNDDEMMCSEALPNPNSTTSRVLKFEKIESTLSLTIDGIEIEKCTHIMTETPDATNFVDAPMRFGGGSKNSDKQNLHAQLSNIKLVGATSDTPSDVTSGGVVGIARVNISDFTTPSPIWFPDDGGNKVDKDGQIKLCVVTSIKIDYNDTATGDGTDGGVVTDKEYTVTHMDSKRTISIDLAAEIGAQVVDITQSIATNSETDAVLEIPVDSFLCNNKNVDVTAGKFYTVGQNFRFCVGPTATGYNVDNYIELTCGGRSLITADAKGLTYSKIDVLTEIDSAFDTDGVLGVRSVITAEDVILALANETGSDLGDGQVKFTCTGKVSLSYNTTSTRYLQTSTELVTTGAGAGTESLEGLFEVSIEMDVPSVESPAPPLTTAASIGFGSVLSSVVVFLLM